jgi:zinc D-Ala-D-Ala dipeptidase
MQRIPVNHLVFFDELAKAYPLKVDLVYAQPSHADNHFGPIYDARARMLGHRDLAAVICLSATRLFQSQGWILVLKDCLRPVEAQEKMIETDIVKSNPHWLIEPRFLSNSGQGGHPRGMAVDVGAIDVRGIEINFGTPFDYFSSSTNVSVNKAHRDYKNHSDDIKNNRSILEGVIVNAAKDLGFEILPLPQEWWDFRFLSSYTNQFEPIADADLPDGYWTTKSNTVVANSSESVEYIDHALACLSVIGPCARP